MRRSTTPWLLLALVPYVILASTTVQKVGVVGEVALGWMRGPPVEVAVEFDAPPVEHAIGPLRARQTRPIERLQLGSVHLPLAINSYTGGLPDWPARAVHAATHSTRQVWALHLTYGALLLAGLFHFLRKHAGLAAATAATMVLGSRWDFVFYRSVLGGTEAVLVGATLGMVWALWHRRWRGGPGGVAAIALAVGIGLHAKLTFVLVAAAIAAAATILRSDRPAMGPPAPARPLRVLAAVMAPLVPLVVANVHQRCIPDPTIHSHDHVQLQLDRVFRALQGDSGPSRESLDNVVYWLGDPVGFLGRAYGVEDVPAAPWALVALGWAVLGVGVLMVWRQRHPTPREALLRFGSILIPLGVGLILVVARDLHHLATLSVVVAMVAGLAADQVAGRWAPPRSNRRVLAALVLVSPWVASGAIQLAQTDPVVQQVQVPTFRADGQAALAALLRDSGARQVWVSDYESMGALELALDDGPPGLHHVWGVASRRAGNRELQKSFPADLLRAAVGDHLLRVRASAPMIYNFRTRGRQLDSVANESGVRLVEVGRLADEQAVLYRVEPQPVEDAPRD